MSREPPQSDRQMRFDLKQVAVVAFMIGVLLHACVLISLMDSGGSSAPRGPVEIVPAGSVATPQPTRMPDRMNCEQIRGTDYRSEAERQWFIANCTG
jgi:hypothetical protein